MHKRCLCRIDSTLRCANRKPLFKPTRKTILSKWLISLWLFLILGGCQSDTEALNTHRGLTMGTNYSVQWWGKPSPKSEKIIAQFEQRLLEINQAMSTYIEDSELSRFNRLPAGASAEISDDFSQVIHAALDIAKLSQGAFDFTVGPLVDLWGFGPPGERTTPPEEAEITAVMSGVGYQNVSLQEKNAKLSKQQQSEIDLSAIAKGYAVDALASVLEGNGFENYLVEIGGELRASGVKPDNVPWRAGIETPQAQGRVIQQVLELKDISVATSGDYRNYFEQNGIRYSHTIDPSNGYPVTHRLASVTVLDSSCARADALATAIMVMGPEKGMQFAEQQALAVYFLIRESAGFKARWSLGFEGYVME